MFRSSISLLFLLLSIALILFGTAAKASASDSFKIPESITIWQPKGETVIAKEEMEHWLRPSVRIIFKRKTATEAISPTNCPFKLLFCDFSLPISTRFSASSKSSFSPDKEKIRNFLDRLQEETRISAIDAVFSIRDNNTASTFAPSRDGSEIDVDAAIKSIEAAFFSRDTDPSQIIRLPTRTISPKITSTDADRLGITKFLGEGRTSFAGSPRNRIFNIKRALEQFQGVLIAPGEEFSFVQHLGPVDGEHGYLPELVIKRGRTEPEFGGGICQVSTTFFRAALNTGQKITERRNHAYPVSYYRPYGMDATVYVPRPDFRFRNETPAHILIQAAVEGTDLVVRFYGTPDGRTVTIDGPHVTSRLPDGGMKTIFVQKVFSANGSTLFEDTFKSSYESPSKYPHPGEEKLSQKPKNWSEKQWDAYMKTGALPR